MVKKAVFAVLVLGLLAGGFFYWWNSQSDVRELNKTLPDGVRVVKGLFGKEYKVINKIDGYEFKVPRGWGGVNKLEYVPKQEEKGRTSSSVYLEGREGMMSIVSVDAYEKNKVNIKLEEWAESLLHDYGLSGEFKNENIGDYDTIGTQEQEHLSGAFIYLLNYSKIYVLTARSEDFIRYIITNGKW